MKNTLSEIGGQAFIGTLYLPSCCTVDEWIEKFSKMGIAIDGKFLKCKRPMTVYEFYDKYCADCDKKCDLSSIRASKCKYYQEVFGK